MLGELGLLALILAMLVSASSPLIALKLLSQSHARAIVFARNAAYLQAVLIAISFATLTALFVQQDFSVAYVAQNSNLKLPVLYRFSAVWGAHEGSLLLWALILALWSAAFAWRSQAMGDAFRTSTLSVLGLISAGFAAFIVFTSNPFLRHLPALADGADLNPLLQDPGLIIHPPMLYAGYVGFAVPFAIAVAALMQTRFDSTVARWMRPWALCAWAFLTFGIALGSWWAYYELGWGGWWFWDPVENASFMPWLIGTALIHSLAVSDKRGTFRAWSLLLAIFAFGLSLLGTFLVRSGVLTSVHAFASDPERGLFVLAFLFLVVGGALTLFAIRAPKLGDPQSGFETQSRETLILINNIVLCVATGMVLLGTLFPLIAEAMNWGKISVGPPYFGTLFVPLIAIIVVFLPFGPFARWRSDGWKRWLQSTRVALLAAAVIASIATVLLEPKHWKVFAGVLGSIWILVGVIVFVRALWRDPSKRAALRPGGVLGMTIAHLGMSLFVLGAMLTDVLSIEKDLRMQAGDVARIGAYEFKLEQFTNPHGPNFQADGAAFIISKNGKEVTRMQPQKRVYANGQVMTEADLKPGLFRDLYLAMGEPLDGGKAWAIRIYVKPFIRFIWLGALMMMFGGFIAILDRRYRTREVESRAPVTAEVESAAVGAH